MTVHEIHESVRKWRWGSLRELKSSQANLTHLIYSMEHDPSLDAESTKISSLKEMLESVERQLHAGHRLPHFS